MISVPRRLAAIAAVTALVAACGGGTPAPSAPASTGPGQSQAATTAPSVAPSPVAVVPDGQLVVATRLTVCSDIPYPPLEYFDANGDPTGSDIDIATEIANRLGLKVAIENTVFDTIIAALQGGKCDIIISDQNITTERVKQVDMIPYFQAGQAFVVTKGNPAGLKTTNDLCGKKIAAETGTTEVDYLDGTGDYKGGKGLTQACTSAGKPAIITTPFQKDSDAALALQAGQVDAYFADFPVAANYANTKPDVFELSPIPQLAPALAGISVQNTGHADLEKAVQTALISMINDGTYLNILKKYSDDAGAITADIAGQVNKTTLP